MSEQQKKTVKIYTDGACSGNPGKGGIGIILVYKKIKKKISIGYELTTNNRMELMAVVIALEQLKKNNTIVHLYSDSTYVVNSVEKKWLDKWLQNDFNSNKIKNKDLWLRYIELAKKHVVNFHWVKGHAEDELNKECDRMAVESYKKGTLIKDIEYEKI